MNKHKLNKLLKMFNSEDKEMQHLAIIALLTEVNFTQIAAIIPQTHLKGDFFSGYSEHDTEERSIVIGRNGGVVRFGKQVVLRRLGTLEAYFDYVKKDQITYL